MTSVAASRDGQLITGSLDKNLKAWQPRPDADESLRGEGHDHVISATMLTCVNGDPVALTGSRCVSALTRTCSAKYVLFSVSRMNRHVGVTLTVGGLVCSICMCMCF